MAYEHPTAAPTRVDVAWKIGLSWVVASPQNPYGVGDSNAPLLALDAQDFPVVAWTQGDLSVFEGPDPTRRILAARMVPGPAGPTL